MPIYTGNYNVLSDPAGSVIPLQLSIAQLNAAGGTLLDVSSVGNAPSGVFGAVKGITLDLQALTAGTVTLTSPDLAGWQSVGAFGGFQIVKVPGQTSRILVTGVGCVGGIAALTLWNSTPSSEVQSLANLNATVAGSVTISGIANVAITGTPNVNVANTPDVVISGTPNVNIAGTPNVNIANSPAVTISGTPNVNIPGNVNVATLGSINVANAYMFGRINPTANFSYFSDLQITHQLALFTTGANGATIQSIFFAVTGATSSAGGVSDIFLVDTNSGHVFLELAFSLSSGQSVPYAVIIDTTQMGWPFVIGSALAIEVYWAAGSGAITGGLLSGAIGYYLN